MKKFNTFFSLAAKSSRRRLKPAATEAHLPLAAAPH